MFKCCMYVNMEWYMSSFVKQCLLCRPVLPWCRLMVIDPDPWPDQIPARRRYAYNQMSGSCHRVPDWQCCQLGSKVTHISTATRSAFCSPLQTCCRDAVTVFVIWIREYLMLIVYITISYISAVPLIVLFLVRMHQQKEVPVSRDSWESEFWLK